MSAGVRGLAVCRLLGRGAMAVRRAMAPCTLLPCTLLPCTMAARRAKAAVELVCSSGGQDERELVRRPVRHAVGKEDEAPVLNRDSK